MPLLIGALLKNVSENSPNWLGTDKLFKPKCIFLNKITVVRRHQCFNEIGVPHL